ncbi:unnamed protein product [Peronospora belbahrii]|uniref:Alpha-L-arabinofuranosidase B catalytic domain-containing protein n=1 Tax=Peronospora belbahrii TaxID=622444 RepID=A0AAU9L9J9_9STRA|nr:unnamed protein product [Peronospora belbahrii]
MVVRSYSPTTKLYGLAIEPGSGYQNIINAKGLAVGDEAQIIYMVVNGKVFNDGCYFTYGNAKKTANYDPGTMEAIYFGSNRNHGCGVGNGPWVMVDMSNGLFGCAETCCPNNPSVTYEFVTAMLLGRTGGQFTLRTGNAQYSMLEEIYLGERPEKYKEMKKQGGIVLGIGGDCNNKGRGVFYEGLLQKASQSIGLTNELVETFFMRRMVKQPNRSKGPERLQHRANHGILFGSLADNRCFNTKRAVRDF